MPRGFPYAKSLHSGCGSSGVRGPHDTQPRGLDSRPHGIRLSEFSRHGPRGQGSRGHPHDACDYPIEVSPSKGLSQLSYLTHDWSRNYNANRTLLDKNTQLVQSY